MPRESDAGAAVVEFVLISLLLLVLLFGVVQVGVFFYERNVIEASVADAARYAASAGVSPRAAESRAHQLIADSLGEAQADAVRCHGRRETYAGLPTVTVHCSGHARALLVPFDIPMPVDVTSSSLQETLQ